MSHHRRTVAMMAASATIIVMSAGCTTGDGKDQVKADDGGDAAAAIAGALDDARASSGRYRTAVTVVTGDPDHPSKMTQTGEFSGEDSVVATELTEPNSDGDIETLHTDRLQVDGRTYGSPAALEGLNAMSGPDDMYDLSAVDGKDWIDVTDLVPVGAMDEVGVDPFVASFVMGWMTGDPFELLGRISDVAETPSDGIDGEPTRHFTAAMPADQVLELILAESTSTSTSASADAETSPADDDGAGESERAWDERQAIADRYVDEHTSVKVELDLDSQDHLRRVRVESSTSIEDQYEDCWAFATPYDSISITTDFSDLGSEIAIDPPDPDTVMPLDDFVAAFPDPWVDDEESDSIDDEGIDEAIEAGPEVQTVDGPRQRDAVVNDLSKYGYVIGLTPDPWVSDPDRTSMPSVHVSAAAVETLSDEELVASYAEADAVLASMPRITTVLGELTRPELLWNVKVGMRNLGIDLAVADGMSDEQLGAIIDTYVADNGWIVGDGIWGDMSQELLDSFHANSSPGPEDVQAAGPDVEDEFEGCPA